MATMTLEIIVISQITGNLVNDSILAWSWLTIEHKATQPIPY